MSNEDREPSNTTNTTETESNVKVEARTGESTEQLLRRFNDEVHKAGVMKRLFELQFYEKPSKKRQREVKIREQTVRKFSE